MSLYDLINILTIVGLSILSIYVVIWTIKIVVKKYYKPEFALTHRKDVKHAGSFIVNTTDPNKDVIRFELDIPIVELMNQKTAIFTIVHEDGDGA